MITNYVFCFNDIKQKQCLGSWRICTTCMNRNVDNARTPKHMSDKSTLKQQKCCFKFQQTNKQTNKHTCHTKTNLYPLLPTRPNNIPKKGLGARTIPHRPRAPDSEGPLQQRREGIFPRERPRSFQVAYQERSSYSFGGVGHSTLLLSLYDVLHFSSI